MRGIACACGLAVWVALAATALPARSGDEPEAERLKGSPLVRLLPPDAIPAIDSPKLVSRQEGERFMLSEEPVLGVVVGGEARAYSLWILDSHEIVNDVIGGTPVAATW